MDGGGQRYVTPPSPNGSNGHANGHANGTAALAESLPGTAALPAPPAAGGRDAHGRFARGNRGGPGNPHARRVAELRSALLEALTPERMRALAESLYASALGGDVAAAKLLLAYTLGRPAPAVDPDRLDSEEWRSTREGPHCAEVLALMDRVSFSEALVMLGDVKAANAVSPLFPSGSPFAPVGAEK
jgi:hypothetical protein